MTTTILIIALIVGAGIFFLLKGNPSNQHLNKNRPPLAEKPTEEQPNDKIIIVQNSDKEQLIKSFEGFCNLYNQEAYNLLPRLITVEKDVFAIIFPYDIAEMDFYFMVNYLKYPLGSEVESAAQIKGWLTQNAKKTMVYNSEDSEEFDGVILTEEDNKTYFLCFDESKKSKSDTIFQAVTFDVTILDKENGEDFM
jgi:hypothetical protein